MAAPKMNRLQREAHLAEVARRYLNGEREFQIGQALGVSQPQISYDMRLLVGRWRKSAATDIEAAKSLELARVDMLERTYWEAWRDSKAPREISQTSRSENGHVSSHASLRKEQRDGNPAFLLGVQWCINKRCEIRGLDAPLRVDVYQRIRQLADEYGFGPEAAKQAVEECERMFRGRS